MPVARQPFSHTRYAWEVTAAWLLSTSMLMFLSKVLSEEDTLRQIAERLTELTGVAELAGKVVHDGGDIDAVIRLGPHTFAPKSSRIARWLLMHPTEWFSQNDQGVFDGTKDANGIRCVHPVQIYLER